MQQQNQERKFPQKAIEERLEHELLIRTGAADQESVFGADLCGYAAQASAIRLVESWKSAILDGSTDNLLLDVDDVIERLQAFKARAALILGTASGHNVEDPKSQQTPSVSQGAPELECVVLENSDAALFLNGEVIYSLDANDEGQSAPDLGRAIASALGVSMGYVEMAVPLDSDWNWNDVFELLPAETPANDTK